MIQEQTGIKRISINRKGKAGKALKEIEDMYEILSDEFKINTVLICSVSQSRPSSTIRTDLLTNTKSLLSYRIIFNVQLEAFSIK